MKLSKRIALFVGLLVLIVASGLGTISIVLGINTASNEARKGLDEASIQGANYVNSSMRMRTAVLEQVANRISDMSLEEQLGVLAEEAEELGYLDMAVVNTEGIAKYAIGGEEADLSEREYVQDALYGKAGFSDVLISKVTNGTVIMYAAPIESGDKVVGALIGRKDGVSLNDIVKSMTFGKEGSAFILGSDGTFYAHNDEAIVMEQRNVIKDIEENGEFKDFGNKFSEFRISKEGNIEYRLNGEEFDASLTMIPNTDWVLALKAPKSEIMRGINSMVMLLVLFSVIFIAAGVVTAFILGKSISKPITSVVDLLNNMSQYDMTIENNDKANKYINRSDEIGIMANATLVLQ
ncbi:MAG: mcpC3, partial [Herbinix sp.]|nr:mcpC3 [Herbinix sp.]